MDTGMPSLIVLRFVFHQVFLGRSAGLHIEGNELPSLVYVSGEKRPGFTHYKEAGAMKELIPVSAHEQLDLPVCHFPLIYILISCCC
jgi:hypothetical protein